MSSVDRKYYCINPTNAYMDSPQYIGHGATISAPHMHAHALEIISEKISAMSSRTRIVRMLDVGSGSGYLAICMAKMIEGMGTGSLVVGIEHIKELVDSSISNVKMDSSNTYLLENGIVKFVVGDGREGFESYAPYDVIHVGAASKEVPQPLLDQLAIDGILIIPVGNLYQSFNVYTKREDGSLDCKKVLDVRYVPLTSPEDQESRQK